MTPADGHIQQNDVVGFTIPVNLVKDWSNINFICKAHQAGEELREIPFEIKLKGGKSTGRYNDHVIVVLTVWTCVALSQGTITYCLCYSLLVSFHV